MPYQGDGFDKIARQNWQIPPVMTSIVQVIVTNKN